MASRSRSFFFTLLIYMAFFASGAAGLVAEVTWNRMLIVVVGNSLSATAMIIMIFMGGLGLGSYLGGRCFGRRRISLLPYLIIEVAIGLYVMLSPALFRFLTSGFETAAEGIDAQTGLTLVRLLVSAGALLLPAVLMGATFPAIVGGAALDLPGRRTARTGFLYSANTIGAALGTFAAGYHLLLEFGVSLTLKIAFGLYLFAALAALVANRLREEAPAAEVAAARREAAADSRRAFIYAATFAVGFVALAYEVLLTRLSILYLGNSVSVFPLVLTGFLLGTGISAWLGTRLYDSFGGGARGGERYFSITALAAGLFMLATPYFLLSDWIVSAGQFARFADSTVRNPLPILGVVVAPTILIGALLPVAIRMFGGGGVTRSAANLYSLNTLGGLLGAGLVNHYLVPRIGIQGALVTLAAICVAVALTGLLRPGRRPGRWLLAGAGVALFTALMVFALPGMMQRYADKIAAGTMADSASVRLVQEGKAATVTVIDQKDSRLGDYLDMYLNGVEEASTRYWHTQLFKLLGILPVVTHAADGPKDAVVIAFGAGITAGSVLASDEVASLDVVDLNPDIEGINDLFTSVNGDVYHQDRFNFHNDDGRNFLVTTHKRYDLIIGDSTHPRAYDSWILYTEEFYELAKRRLKPGGVFAQWVPVLGSMRGELFRIHLNTFRKVFPNTTFWYVYGSDQAFLMSTPEPYVLDVERLEGKLARLPEWFKAEHYQIDRASRVAGFFWMDGSAMAQLIGPETRVNTDDAHYFDKQTAVRPLPPNLQLPRFQAAVLPHLKGGDGPFRAAVQKEQRLAGHLGRYAFYGSKPELHKAWCLDPANGNADYYMRLEFRGRLPEQGDFCLDSEMKQYRALIAQHPDNHLALNGLADLLSKAGRLDEALVQAQRAVALMPENGMLLDTQGWILHLQGRQAEAIPVLERSLAALPEHPIVLYHLGAAELAAGDSAAARAYLERALEASGSFEGAAEARRLLAGPR